MSTNLISTLFESELYTLMRQVFWWMKPNIMIPRVYISASLCHSLSVEPYINHFLSLCFLKHTTYIFLQMYIADVSGQFME